MSDGGWGGDPETVRYALAGASGGVVRALTLKQSPWETASTALVGLLSSIFLGPSVGPMLLQTGLLEVVPAHATGGFLVGLGGISVAAFFIDFFKHLRSYRRATGKGKSE